MKLVLHAVITSPPNDVGCPLGCGATATDHINTYVICPQLRAAGVCMLGHGSAGGPVQGPLPHCVGRRSGLDSRRLYCMISSSKLFLTPLKLLMLRLARTETSRTGNRSHGRASVRLASAMCASHRLSGPAGCGKGRFGWAFRCMRAVGGSLPARRTPESGAHTPRKKAQASAGAVASMLGAQVVGSKRSAESRQGDRADPLLVACYASAAGHRSGSARGRSVGRSSAAGSPAGALLECLSRAARVPLVHRSVAALSRVEMNSKAARLQPRIQ